MSLKEKTISLVIGNGLHALSHIFIIVVCSRLLTADQYGSYRQFFTVYELAVPVVGMGLSQAIFFFFARAEKKFEVLIRAVVILAFAALLVECALLYFKGDVFGLIFNSTVLQAVYPLIGFFVFTSLLIPIVGALFVDANQSRRFSTYNSIYVAFLGVCVSLAAYLSREAVVVVTVRVFFSAAFAAYLLYVARQKIAIPEGFSFSRSLLSSRSINDVLRYSVPLGAASSVGMIAQQTDKLIVSAYSSPADFAVYVNGAMEIPLISILTGALATAAISELTVKVRRGELEQSLGLFRRVASLSSLVLFPVFVFFMVVADVFVVALFGERYLDSSVPFRIYLLLIPARIVFFGPVLVAFGETRTVLVRSVVELVLVVGLGLVFVRLFGYVGVAAAIVVVTYLWSVLFNLFRLKRCFKCDFSKLLPYRDLVKKLVVSLLLAPVAYLSVSFASSSPVVAIFISLAAYCVAFCFVLLWIGDPDAAKLRRYMKGPSV